MNAFAWTWEAHKVRIHASRFHHERGGISAECVVEKQVGAEWTRFTSYRISLTSISGRRDFIKELKELWQGPDWVTIIHQLCDRTLAAYRAGEQSQASQGEQLPEMDTYILNPLLFAGHTSILYGPGDSGKSVLSVLAALLLAQGGNAAGLAAGGGFTPLLLDWERAYSTFDSRVRSLTIGHPELADAKDKLWYQRMHQPLHESIEDVSETIQARKADVLILDSLGMAAGGDLNSPEAATRLFEAIRTLDLPALIIGHTAKSTEGDKTVFGSAFFFNLASSVWEVAADHQEESSTLSLGLYNRKNNLGPRRKPFGLSIAFTGESCTVSEANLSESPTLSAKLSRAQRIKSLLLDHQFRGLVQIADTLDDDPHAIRTELNRHKGKLWDKVGEEWGIL